MMLLQPSFVLAALALLLGPGTANAAPPAASRKPQGAAACLPSKTQPYVFSGVLVVRGAGGYADETEDKINYLAPQRAYDNNEYLFYRRDVQSVYKKSVFDGAIATPCDAFRSRVAFSTYGYEGVDAYEVGILRRSTNPRQCLQMVPYNPACQNSICSPDTPDNYYKRAELDARRVFGIGFDLRWSTCPTTDAAVLANSGEFLFAWAYNSTAQAGYRNIGPVALQHPRVFVSRANEITNPGTVWARNGYSLGDRVNGSAVLVGTAYKSNFDPIQLISASLTNSSRTQAEVERQTEPFPFIFE